MITGSHNPSDYNGFKVMHGKANSSTARRFRSILHLIQTR